MGGTHSAHVGASSRAGLGRAEVGDPPRRRGHARAPEPGTRPPSSSCGTTGAGFTTTSSRRESTRVGTACAFPAWLYPPMPVPAWSTTRPSPSTRTSSSSRTTSCRASGSTHDRRSPGSRPDVRENAPGLGNLTVDFNFCSNRGRRWSWRPALAATLSTPTAPDDGKNRGFCVWSHRLPKGWLSSSDRAWWPAPRFFLVRCPAAPALTPQPCIVDDRTPGGARPLVQRLSRSAWRRYRMAPARSAKAKTASNCSRLSSTRFSDAACPAARSLASAARGALPSSS